MSHEQLWAPWRLAYIKGDKEPDGPPRPCHLLPGADPACFLCRAVGESADRENLVVFRARHTVVMLNRYPYNNGHLLVAPRRHAARLDQVTIDEHSEIQTTITRFVELIEQLMQAEGFNVGLNLGRAAGAGLPGHLHWHVVPRWNGDTNFMDVVAGVDVIPQSLAALWQLLTEALDATRGHASP